MDDHLREGHLCWSDRSLERALEVDDAQQLTAVDDRRRDLASDVVAGHPVVGIDEDVRHELGLECRGRPADDACTDLQLVEWCRYPATPTIVSDPGRRAGTSTRA